DATVLLLLLSPLLYYFGFRPLVLHIAERVRAEDALRDSEMRYRSVAQLGQRALANAGLSALLDEAAALVARTLDVTYCKVLELLPDGKALLLRAGAGWREGVMGQVTMGAVDSQAEYTLLSRNPVIVEDFSTETRFGVPPLLHDHDVVSGISVIIYDEGQPFGIMGAYTTEHRSFTQDDAHFLQAVANVLAEAIQRKRADDESRRSANKLAMLNQMLDQSNRELTTLYNTGSLLSATLDPDEISRVMFHQIIQPLLDVPHFTIALFDPETQTIFCRFAIIDGEEADVAQFPPFSLGEGPASDTIRTRQARIVDLEDIRPALEKRGRGVQIGDERRTKSALYVPMIAGDQAIGVMNVQSYAPNAFRGVDLAILTTIASQATVALENARLFAETQRYARELEAGIRQRRQAELELTRLYRASETLLSSAAPDTKTMAQSIVEIALREFGQSNCSLLLVNEGQSDLDRIAVAGPYTRDVVKGRLKLDGPGLVPKAIRLSRIINVSDVMDDPNYVPNWEAARSELAIPLKIGERVIGVIDVQSTEVSAFGPDDERLMSTFAEKAALALQTALLHEQTERSLQRLAALRNIDMTISGSLD
ncbi:MAG: GAF domain-containing protein, partial [Anaerolineales bacterium]